MNKNLIIALSLLLVSLSPLHLYADSSNVESNKPVLVTPLAKEDLYSDILSLVNKDYGLSKDYVPKNLRKVNLPSAKGKDHLTDIAATSLEEMFRDAKQNGHNLFAQSGYRSYARQNEIFSMNVKKYGRVKAETFSAPPGHSEHQTGLVMDLSSKNTNYALIEKFGTLPEGKWVAQNAWKYGFVIRYPKDKTHITKYSYEPWHIRYVGREAAKVAFDEGLALEELIGR